MHYFRIILCSFMFNRITWHGRPKRLKNCSCNSKSSYLHLDNILLCVTIFWNRTLRLLMDVHFIWLISLFLWTPFFLLLFSTIAEYWTTCNFETSLDHETVNHSKEKMNRKKTNEKINTRGTLLILVFKRFCNILYKVRLQKDF